MDDPVFDRDSPVDALAEPSTDWGFRIILVGVGLVVVWVIAMPWAPPVAGATMRRFHLQSESFVTWSAQFPIPAMYNFANRYQFCSVPPSMISEGLISDFATPPKWRYANHFPTRVFTFGDGRYNLYRSGKPLWVDFESRYRGQVLVSQYELRPHESDSGYDVIRPPAKINGEAESLTGNEERDPS